VNVYKIVIQAHIVMNLLVSLAITTSIVAAGDVTDNTEFAGDAVTSFLL